MVALVKSEKMGQKLKMGCVVELNFGCYFVRHKLTVMFVSIFWNADTEMCANQNFMLKDTQRKSSKFLEVEVHVQKID